jgi:cyclic pyranopterin phosphate synthase
VNCVVTRDYNDMDVVDLARRCLERGWQPRFIELMPLGEGETARLSLSQFVPSRETRERLEAELGPLVPVPPVKASDEARYFRFERGGGTVGFISPVSEPYCGACNRMRLTADGRFHLCLLHDDELDVKQVLRSGGGEAEVAAILVRAVGLKPTGHQLDEGISTRDRSMFQIGG